MKKLKFFLVVIFFFGFLGSQAQAKKAIKVLFVGNSFTYYYNLPQVVQAMAASQNIEIETRQSTVGGSNLEQHWKKEKGTRTMRLLDSAKWDFVVFNNHSTSPIETPDAFYEYGKKFAELVKSKGATPVFMMTWAYKSDPLMYSPLRDGYKKLAKETKSELVPCGELFEAVRTLRPTMEMYFDDKHPSANATYMLGLAFLKYFTHASVDKIAPRITTRDKDGELLYLLFMHNEDADFLKKIVNGFNF